MYGTLIITLRLQGPSTCGRPVRLIRRWYISREDAEEFTKEFFEWNPIPRDACAVSWRREKEYL